MPGPFPRGRRCAESNCGTILSTYNALATCWVQSSPEPATKRESRGDLIDLLHQLGGYTPIDWRTE